MTGETAAVVLDHETKRNLLTAIAHNLESRLPDIVRTMRDHLTSNIGELNNDPQLVEMMYASIEGNVATICHVLANDIAIDKLQPTTAAVEYAARLAQRDIPVSALTRAYYLGQSMFIRLGIDAVEQLPVPEAVRIALIRAVADTVHHYIDWILQYLSALHEAERRRWWNTRTTKNVAAVTRFLSGNDASGALLRMETGYEVDRPHVALVVWSEADGGDEEQQLIERLIRRVASALGSASPPLIAAADRATAWAWLSDTVAPHARAAVAEAVADTPRLRVAISDVGVGGEGFKLAHEQAIKARKIALISAQHVSRTVVGHSDEGVALLSVFVDDLTATRRWVRSVLGELAEDTELAETIRTTLAGFFENRENIVQTATALGLHRNTVRQRIDRYQRSAQRPLDPLEGALALRLFDAFGA